MPGNYVQLVAVLFGITLVLCSLLWVATPFAPRRSVPWRALDVLAVVLTVVAVMFTCGLVVAVAQWAIREPPIERELAQVEAAEPVEAQQHDQAHDAVTTDAEPADAEPDAHQPMALDQLLAQVVGSILSLFAVALVLHLRTGATASDMGLDYSRFGYDLGIGWLAFLAVSLPVYGLMSFLATYVEPSHPLTDVVEHSPGIATLVVSVILATLVAPIFEEFLFRGVLQGWLEAHFDDVWQRRHAVSAPLPDEPRELTIDAVSSTPPVGQDDAAVASEVDAESQVPPLALIETRPIITAPVSPWPGVISVVLSSTPFSLMHILYGPSAAPLFLLALGLGFLYRRTHRLLPSIVVHVILNSVGMAAVLLSDAGAKPLPEPLPALLLWATGWSF